MDLTPTIDELRFRDEFREWLDRNHPGSDPGLEGDAESFAWRRAWQRKLADGGWAGVDWPDEYGGRGASIAESSIFFEELAQAGAPLPANALGVLLAGPTLIAWGTTQQKERWLEPILSGEEIWCQGFSEPEAGSDLASLKTRGVRCDDGWRVSGQKVWTSMAQYAKWCMLLARTDMDAERHRGLTYFVLDMDQPGVQVRPLKQITGHAEFNEVFLDDAWIADENVVGMPGAGWAVALTTLMNERAGLAMFLQVQLRQRLHHLLVELARRGRLDDPVLRDRLAQLHISTEVLRFTALRGLDAADRSGQSGPEGSLTKLMWSETNQRLVQLAVDELGPDALEVDSTWSNELLRARGNSIEGGTTEVLKNILAQRVLGLPRER